MHSIRMIAAFKTTGINIPKHWGIASKFPAPGKAKVLVEMARISSGISVFRPVRCVRPTKELGGMET